MPHIAATGMTVKSVCPKCGITKKFGKISCCGRGGSWVGNCGSVGYKKPDHTWYEGLQACKARARFKAVIVQQVNEAQQQLNGSPDVTTTRSITAADTEDATSSRILISRNFANMFMTTDVRAAVTSQGYKRLLDVTVQISVSLAVALF